MLRTTKVGAISHVSLGMVNATMQDYHIICIYIYISKYIYIYMKYVCIYVNVGTDKYVYQYENTHHTFIPVTLVTIPNMAKLVFVGM